MRLLNLLVSFIRNNWPQIIAIGMIVAVLAIMTWQYYNCCQYGGIFVRGLFWFTCLK